MNECSKWKRSVSSFHCNIIMGEIKIENFTTQWNNNFWQNNMVAKIYFLSYQHQFRYMMKYVCSLFRCCTCYDEIDLNENCCHGFHICNTFEYLYLFMILKFKTRVLLWETSKSLYEKLRTICNWLSFKY